MTLTYIDKDTGVHWLEEALEVQVVEGQQEVVGVLRVQAVVSVSQHSQ